MNDGDKITVGALQSERTDLQAQRAAAVTLPAGSFDAEDLQQGFDNAAKAKNDKSRDELVAKAVEDASAGTVTARPEHGVPPGYKRVIAHVEGLGIDENRVVFDPAKADEAQEPVPGLPSVEQPDAAASTKGE